MDKLLSPKFCLYTADWSTLYYYSAQKSTEEGWAKYGYPFGQAHSQCRRSYTTEIVVVIDVCPWGVHTLLLRANECGNDRLSKLVVMHHVPWTCSWSGASTLSVPCSNTQESIVQSSWSVEYLWAMAAPGVEALSYYKVTLRVIANSLILFVLRNSPEEVGILLFCSVTGNGSFCAVGDHHGLEVFGHAGHWLDGVRTRWTCGMYDRERESNYKCCETSSCLRPIRPHRLIGIEEPLGAQVLSLQGKRLCWTNVLTVMKDCLLRTNVNLPSFEQGSVAKGELRR